MKFQDKRNRINQRFSFMKYLPILFFLLASCSITFSGVKVPPGVETVYVESFINDPSSDYSIPSLGQDCTDELLEKILKETKLVQSDTKPDVEFTGTAKIRISSEAPQAGQASSLDRMEIILQVTYTNHLNEEDNWKQSFTNFENFDPSENLDDIQEELTDKILENIMEDIYQKAFTSW